ncbi:MAG: hypothetical protein IJE07_01580 [Clostridia bacterium]|nr:hypothetical protein [Clostridia bacterium]
MHDRHPFWCTLALMIPLAGLLVAACILGGEAAKDALFAALKLAVIR